MLTFHRGIGTGGAGVVVCVDHGGHNGEHHKQKEEKKRERRPRTRRGHRVGAGGRHGCLVAVNGRASRRALKAPTRILGHRLAYRLGHADAYPRGKPADRRERLALLVRSREHIARGQEFVQHRTHCVQIVARSWRKRRSSFAQSCPQLGSAGAPFPLLPRLVGAASAGTTT